MRILYISHRIPYPPDKGDKIRAFHQIRGLARRHEVDLFTLSDEGEFHEHRRALLDLCREVVVEPIDPVQARIRSLPWLLTRTPLSVPYFRSAALLGRIRKALAQRAYDRIFLYCSPMVQYLPRDNQTPVLLDLVDIDSDKWAQYAGAARFPMSAVYRREAACLRNYERAACRRASCVLVTTGREADLVRRTLGVENVVVLANGVDSQYFSPPAVSMADRAPAVVFTGDMSYFPNQQAVAYFAKEALPLIRKAIPDAQFLIVGRRPNEAVQRLAELPGVTVTGSVPDIRPWLASARVLVAPFLIAAGVPNKILEGMSSGLPVVATPRAVQGLSERVASVIEIGCSPSELAAQTIRFLRDVRLASERGAESRLRVTEEHDWDRSTGRLIDLLDNPSPPLQAPATQASFA